MKGVTWVLERKYYNDPEWYLYSIHKTRAEARLERDFHKSQYSGYDNYYFRVVKYVRWSEVKNIEWV